MTLKIEKAAGIGFCYGVKRAVEILEKVSGEHANLETLGAIVHNKQVIDRLAKKGVRIADSIEDIRGDTVVIGAHGVSPQVEEEIKSRNINIINTTCGFVQRAQNVAEKLANSGFYVIIFGDVNHPEVKGILARAGGNGIATMDIKSVASLEPLPRHIGVVAQTTQIPAHFIAFVKDLLDAAFTKDTELRIIDTICHDIRGRQSSALDVAKRVDLMLVVGDQTSANTNRLTELCSAVTTTYLIETADDIKPEWLKEHPHTGITGGASTADETISEVLKKLEQYK